jgi:hypothetical protein
MAPAFDHVTWPAAPSTPAYAARPAAPLLQVRDRARAAWK